MMEAGTKIHVYHPSTNFIPPSFSPDVLIWIFQIRLKNKCLPERQALFHSRPPQTLSTILYPNHLPLGAPCTTKEVETTGIISRVGTEQAQNGQMGDSEFRGGHSAVETGKKQNHFKLTMAQIWGTSVKVIACHLEQNEGCARALCTVA